LDKIDRFTKVLGFVNSADGFNQQSKTVNSALELLTVFEEIGEHARCAVKMKGLPNNIAVEVEMIVSIKD
jgi:enamine deaminase RidA (YjgF/YER057c/UK114 family)